MLKEIIRFKYEAVLVTLMVVITVLFTYRDYIQGFEMIEGQRHSKFNNYVIFSNSYDVLKAGEYLYGFHGVLDDIRIVLGNAIVFAGLLGIDIDPQNFAQ